MATTLDEHQQWHDSTTGELLVNGSVYIGLVNLDPTVLANQITLYSDRALTTPIANPQTTDANGQTENKIWFADQKYSISVTDSSSVVKYTELDNGAAETFTQSIEFSGGITIGSNEVGPQVDSMTDLLALDETKITAATLRSFHDGEDNGGGQFYYDSAEDRANHNGITIIDPTNTADLSVWDAAEQTTWFTAGTGTGCWIRIYDGAINVLWAGAKGDGATDDIKPIQATIDLVVAITPGTVYLPNGTYLINGLLTQLTGINGVSFLGENATLKQTSTATVGMISILNADNFNIDGITFDSNDYNSTSAVTLLITSCKNFNVRFNRFIKTPYIGLGIESCKYFNVLDNDFSATTAESFTNYSINVSSNASTSQYGVVSGNTSINQPSAYWGLDISITGNHFDSYAYGAGIATQPVLLTSGRYAITGNTCINGTGNDDDGFDVAGMEIGGDDSVVSGNICAHNAGNGIRNFSKRATITGNNCYENGETGTTANDRAGIANWYSTTTINGNYSTITGNTCYDLSGTGGGGPQDYGYLEQSASLTGIHISGNNFENNDLGEMSLQSTRPSIYPKTIEYSATWDPASIAVGASATKAVTASGAVLGDYVIPSFTLDVSGLTLTADVTGTNLITAVLSNNTAGAVDLASGTLKLKLIKATI